MVPPALMSRPPACFVTGPNGFRCTLVAVWVPDKSKLVKVCLHSRGDDVETPWAEDLGEAPGRPGARLVRLGNVPFFHAKPTYEDVLVVEYDPTYNKLTWDSGGLPYERILECIAEDCGRYAVIIDYDLVPPTTDAQPAFKLLDVAGEKMNMVVEGMRGPEDGRPGRAYLAVPYDIAPILVMAYLDEQKLPMRLTLVHPV
jgi:hypothetical protein